MRALVVLAEVHQVNPAHLTKAESIARAQGMPGKFLEVILGQLARSGIVASHRGATGGYRLSRPATDISLAEVIAALDGATAERPTGSIDEAQPSAAVTGADQVWDVLRQHTHHFLVRTSLADVASGERATREADIAITGRTPWS